MRFAIWLSVGLGFCGCGPSGPAAGATEVVPAAPQQQPSATAAITAAAQLESQVKGDGCLVVAEPYQLDFPKEKLERNRKRREAEEAERIRPNPCPEEDRSEECRYFRARVHFEADRFDLAAKGFRELALEANSEVGPYAAQLALESLNLLATRAVPPRTACVELLAKDNDAYLARYCKPVGSAGDETCDAFARIRVDVRRLAVEKLVRAADAGPPNDSTTLYGQAGDGYRALFKDSCEDPASKRLGLRCEELLYNGYRAYRSAGRVEDANEVRATLLNPRYGLERTELAKKLAKEPQLTPP
jgi:hypothetical protein